LSKASSPRFGLPSPAKNQSIDLSVRLQIAAGNGVPVILSAPSCLAACSIDHGLVVRITVISWHTNCCHWAREANTLRWAFRASPTERPKQTYWAVRFGPFGWPSGHPDSGPRLHVRLGRTLRPTRGRSANEVKKRKEK
jgi:hypothetical protein